MIYECNEINLMQRINKPTVMNKAAMIEVDEWEMNQIQEAAS